MISDLYICYIIPSTAQTHLMFLNPICIKAPGNLFKTEVFHYNIKCLQVRTETKWRAQEVADWAKSWLLEEVRDGVEKVQVELWEYSSRYYGQYGSKPSSARLLGQSSGRSSHSRSSWFVTFSTAHITHSTGVWQKHWWYHCN